MKKSLRYNLSMFLCFFLCCGSLLNAQPPHYTVANAHSHNDYEQKTPFWLAYNEAFGSIEADIFLKGGKLIVAHDTNEVKKGRTLEEYYILPLLTCVQKQDGHPYADHSRQLQMLIDIKTDSIATVDSLVALLGRYPLLSKNRKIKWTITGNRPDPSLWTSYPSFVWFDGVLYRDYNKTALSRIVMMSDDLRTYSHWNGRTGIPAEDLAKLKQAIAKSHKLHKPVRFWAAPDTPDAWTQLMGLKVDYINTDHIHELSTFLKHG